MMKDRLLKSVFVCLLSAGFVRADIIQLPYQFSDNSGNQWLVYHQGQLQQQGNQPIFSQTAMMNVNGSQMKSPPNQQAMLDDKTREVTISVDQKTSLKVQRRIKMDEETGIVRIIDLFDNQNNSELQMNIQLTTNTNYGISNATIIEDAKNKTQLGWSADTGAQKAAMTLWGTKGARVTPTIRYNPGNSNAVAQFNFKVQAKDKAALVHWYGVFDNADAGNTWAQQLRESKMLSDVPADIKKYIVNISGGASGLNIGGRELLRGELNDIVELRNGDQMRGDLKIENYDLKTDFGPLSLPANKIVCLLNIGETRSRQLLVTSDGEIFGGELVQQNIPIQLSSGQLTNVPMSQVARTGYRTGGTEPTEWQFIQPMVFLRSGERCLIGTLEEPIELVTRYGPISFKPEQVSTIVLKNAGNAHDIYLSDGSKISGILSKPKWTFKLNSASGNARVEFPLAAISRVLLKPLADDVGAGAATLSTVAGDIVSTRLDGKIKLNTTFDSLDINASEIRSISRTDESSSELVVTLFDQSVFRGVLASPSLNARLTAGVSIEVPVAAIRDYLNPQPFPSSLIIEKVKQQVAQLNADDWKQREAAESVLVNFGPTIIGVLESSSADQSPEAQQRLVSVIKRLKKDSPPMASRLAPPPSMD